MTNTQKYQVVLDLVNKNSSGGGQTISKRNFVFMFNKAQYFWFDQRVKAEEVDKIRQNELQQFVVDICKAPRKSKGDYYTIDLPKDYFYYKRVTAKATKKTCELTIYGKAVEESSVNSLFNDCFNEPSFEWQDSFYTVGDNKLKFYVKDFKIKEVNLVYYRCPKEIDMSDIKEEDVIHTDQECELSKSNLYEVLDITALLLAGNIGDQGSFQAISTYLQQFN